MLLLYFFEYFVAGIIVEMKKMILEIKKKSICYWISYFCDIWICFYILIYVFIYIFCI